MLYQQTNMIDPALKKFEQFQVRKRIKSLSNDLSNGLKVQIQNQENKYKQQLPMFNAQFFPNKKCNKLSSLISYLNSYNSSVCQKHCKQCYKFVCLEESCVDRFGCLQCFYSKHKNHRKVEIEACLRDVEQFYILINSSYELLNTKKINLKNELTQQIDMQICNMEKEFHQNLMFFKNKALNEIENYLFSKQRQLQILNLIRNDRQSSINENAWQAEILNQILKIDMKEIEKSLKSQLKQLHFEKFHCDFVVKIFQQMNTTLSQFTAEFKKNFPKIGTTKHEYQHQSNQLAFFSANNLINNSKTMPKISNVSIKCPEQRDGKKEYLYF